MSDAAESQWVRDRQAFVEALVDVWRQDPTTRNILRCEMWRAAELVYDTPELWEDHP